MSDTSSIIFAVDESDVAVIDKTETVLEPVITTELPTSFESTGIIVGDNINDMQPDLSSNDPVINVSVIGEGPKGPRGLSAYEVWLSLGHVGTEEDFINSVIAYVHPATHPADMIVETDEKQFISLADKLKLSGYIYGQIAASKKWTITHTLNKHPSVTVVDTGGNLVVGEVEYLSASQLIICFSAEFSGTAYLN